MTSTERPWVDWHARLRSQAEFAIYLVSNPCLASAHMPCTSVGSSILFVEGSFVVDYALLSTPSKAYRSCNNYSSGMCAHSKEVVSVCVCDVPYNDHQYFIKQFALLQLAGLAYCGKFAFPMYCTEEHSLSVLPRNCSVVPLRARHSPMFQSGVAILITVTSSFSSASGGGQFPALLHALLCHSKRLISHLRPFPRCSMAVPQQNGSTMVQLILLVTDKPSP